MAQVCCWLLLWFSAHALCAETYNNFWNTQPLRVQGTPSAFAAVVLVLEQHIAAVADTQSAEPIALYVVLASLRLLRALAVQNDASIGTSVCNQCQYRLF